MHTLVFGGTECMHFLSSIIITYNYFCVNKKRVSGFTRSLFFGFHHDNNK